MSPDFGTMIPLVPRIEGDEEQEQWSDERLSNVRSSSLTVYRAQAGTAPRPAIVICPGGGYGLLSMALEGTTVSRWLNELGIDAFILRYRLKEFGYPAPLEDTSRAIEYLRKNAREMGLQPDKIGIMGFSAGGHAAAMASNLFPSRAARPDFSVLAYPVISLHEPFAHAGSRHNLLGSDPNPDLVQSLSMETRVSPDTPPTFLLHTNGDKAVPVENSLSYAAALSKHKVPFALHVYPGEIHGIGMEPGHGAASEWPRALARWLEEMLILRT